MRTDVDSLTRTIGIEPGWSSHLYDIVGMQDSAGVSLSHPNTDILRIISHPSLQMVGEFHPPRG